MVAWSHQGAAYHIFWEGSALNSSKVPCKLQRGEKRQVTETHTQQPGEFVHP